MNTKANYVRRNNRATADHHCHWPGCDMLVAPSRWGCAKHWYALPSHLRVRIWQTFVPGQELSKRPSQAYVEAAKAVQEWIAQQPAAETAPPQGSLL